MLAMQTWDLNLLESDSRLHSANSNEQTQWRKETIKEKTN